MLRHCFLDKLSPLQGQAARKTNNGGLFGMELLTGFAVSEAIWLSRRPILSKAVDCGI
jgi:hypothetical protein